MTKTVIEKKIEECGDVSKAIEEQAKDYLLKHLVYKKKKFLDLNIMTLSFFFHEFYYAGVQHGIDVMAKNLKECFPKEEVEQ